MLTGGRLISTLPFVMSKASCIAKKSIVSPELFGILPANTSFMQIEFQCMLLEKLMYRIQTISFDWVINQNAFLPFNQNHMECFCKVVNLYDQNTNSLDTGIFWFKTIEFGEIDYDSNRILYVFEKENEFIRCSQQSSKLRVERHSYLVGYGMLSVKVVLVFWKQCSKTILLLNGTNLPFIGSIWI